MIHLHSHRSMDLPLMHLPILAFPIHALQAQLHYHQIISLTVPVLLGQNRYWKMIVNGYVTVLLDICGIVERKNVSLNMMKMKNFIMISTMIHVLILVMMWSVIQHQAKDWFVKSFTLKDFESERQQPPVPCDRFSRLLRNPRWFLSSYISAG